jgi:hypothetical protein
MFSTFYGYHSILLLTALGITLSVSADEIPGGAIRTVRARCVGAAVCLFREPLEKARNEAGRAAIYENINENAAVV